MAWKGRKMFSSAVDMQSGGTVPYPSYRGGGAVGATPMERKKMFSIWDKMTKGQKENVMDGKRYQMGGKVMPTQLFEQGDQDINMALNTMASMTNPSVEDISKMETKPMGMDMGKMSKDQGPMDFNTDLMELKKEYKNEIFSFIKKPGAVEELGSYLKTMQLSYQNDLTDIMKRHGVKEYSPEQELFTPEFMEEVKMAFAVPEMQDGGVAMPTTQEQLDAIFSAFPGKYTIEEFNMLPEHARQMLIVRALIEKGTKAQAPTLPQSLYSPEEVKTRLNEIISERMDLAKKSAVMPQTKQGGILGFASQMNAYRANQAKAQSQALLDEANLLKSLGAGSRTGVGSDVVMPADLINRMTKRDDPSKNDEAMFKNAVSMQKANEPDKPLLAVIYFKQLSPDGFLRKFPYYGGTKIINGALMNIDQYMDSKVTEANATRTTPLSQGGEDEVRAKALASWLKEEDEGQDPAGILNQ